MYFKHPDRWLWSRSTEQNNSAIIKFMESRQTQLGFLACLRFENLVIITKKYPPSRKTLRKIRKNSKTLTNDDENWGKNHCHIRELCKGFSRNFRHVPRTACNRKFSWNRPNRINRLQVSLKATYSQPKLSTLSMTQKRKFYTNHSNHSTFLQMSWENLQVNGRLSHVSRDAK